MKIVWAVLGVLAVEVAAFLIFLLLGVYNVAATAPHTRVGQWMRSTM